MDAYGRAGFVASFEHPLIMKVETKIIIEVEGEERDKLASALNKVVADINRIGLKHLGMTTEESELIKDLTDKLNL